MRLCLQRFVRNPASRCGKFFLLGQLQACCLATPGVMVMLAWVAGHGADGCRTEYALMPAETCQKFRFAMRKVFPLGAVAGLLPGHTWCHGHAGMTR